MINVQECWMSFYYNCFKNYDYLRRGRYLSDNNNDGAKTLSDSKQYHIYMYTENKVKSHKATISNIFYYKYSLLLCCC